MSEKNKNSTKSMVLVCWIGAVMLMGVLAGLMMIESGGTERDGNIYKIPKT